MNINFFSQDKPFGHLDAVTVSVPASAFLGHWSTLELQPDLFAPQRFTVGVVVQASQQRLHYHLLSDFKKFECIYSGQLPKKLVADMLGHAEEVLRQAAQRGVLLEEVDFGSANLQLSIPVHTSGVSAESIIERLYHDVVVLEPGTSSGRIRQFESLDTPSVRHLVNQALKSIAGSDFERIVLDAKGGVPVPDGDRTHFLDVNIKTDTACGSVISAVYKTVDRVEMNLLRANLDLTTFARLKHMDDKGVFLMLPERAKLERSEWDRIENVVGEQSWKLAQDGFRVVSGDTPDGLAKEIYDWARPTL
ncbi:hypothetical protein [Duganella hordei]|uniref:hypothetical protein n=1 Tax=Duganella hordei TaxID=2865934 RepID=UPI0030E9205C